MNMGVAIRPSALMTTLVAPCIACFDRRLMVAAGPRILVRQRPMIGSAGSAAVAAKTSRERRRATTSRQSGRDDLRDGLRDVSGTTRVFRVMADMAPAGSVRRRMRRDFRVTLDLGALRRP